MKTFKNNPFSHFLFLISLFGKISPVKKIAAWKMRAGLEALLSGHYALGSEG
jgi:hypothetical protein